MSALVVLTGLPCTGKSTIARAVAQAIPAAYLPVDPVYGALQPFGADDWDSLGKAPYAVVARLAKIHVSLGLSAVVDAVNPLEQIRADYYAVAQQYDVTHVLIHTTCQDEAVYRRRVDERRAGGNPVDWGEVERQVGYYDPPDRPDITLDASDPITANIEQALRDLRELGLS